MPIYLKSQLQNVNNYESGALGGIRRVKNDVSYGQFIRIVESLQAAVEKIPIKKHLMN